MPAKGQAEASEDGAVAGFGLGSGCACLSFRLFEIVLAINQNAVMVFDMNSINEMQPRFHKLVGFLRSFGFKGEVFLKAGMLIIAAYDKNSASMIRSALKKAPSAKLGTTAEVRNKTGGAAFVWVDDELSLNKNEVRELLMAA